MAAPEQEPKPEAVGPSPSREPPLEPEAYTPATAGGRALQPWEQHAAVINLPRYDYHASVSLLLRSCSGFLITCPINSNFASLIFIKSFDMGIDKICGIFVVHNASSICSGNPSVFMRLWPWSFP
ncbi:uncharacterized protein LOC133895512 [Phragmites australis]|uniref:uncharacterized protein LOC133895512 n=1 Tax=Phragmites australis TaxID=29695 RepID=UPI002D7802F1|nr:uncharacterized protein LOC133895512 [Phragmites australis]